MRCARKTTTMTPSTKSSSHRRTSRWSKRGSIEVHVYAVFSVCVWLHLSNSPVCVCFLLSRWLSKEEELCVSQEMPGAALDLDAGAGRLPACQHRVQPHAQYQTAAIRRPRKQSTLARLSQERLAVVMASSVWSVCDVATLTSLPFFVHANRNHLWISPRLGLSPRSRPCWISATTRCSSTATKERWANVHYSNCNAKAMYLLMISLSLS